MRQPLSVDLCHEEKNLTKMDTEEGEIPLVKLEEGELIPSDAKTLSGSAFMSSEDIVVLDAKIISMLSEGVTHLTSSTGKVKKATACSVCGKEGFRSNIKVHIEANHIQGLIFKCNVCGHNSKTRAELRQHKLRQICTKRRKLSENPFNEKIESLIILGTTKLSNKKSAGNSKVRMCKVCGKEGRRQTIKDHIEAYHIQGYSPKCKLCGKKYKTQNSLSVHRRIKNNCKVEHKDIMLLREKVRSLFVYSKTRLPGSRKKGLICKVCGKEGIQNIIKEHIEKLHVHTVSLRCKICGKSFRTRNSLSRHIRSALCKFRGK